MDPKPLGEIQFNRPVYGKRKRETVSRPPKHRIESHSFDEEEALSELRDIFPSAAILTKPDSETDTADEDDDDELPPVSFFFFVSAVCRIASFKYDLDRSTTR